MTKFIAVFKPENFYPVPDGTILRYLGHDYDKDTQRYNVAMEVLGEAPKGTTFPQVIFVNEGK